MKHDLMNMLVDYYELDPYAAYGAGAEMERTVSALREIRPGYIAIYAKGHSGITTWPSSLRTQHGNLAKDMPAFWREATRKAGVDLFFYYSGTIDGLAAERHPEWRRITRDGTPDNFLGSIYGDQFAMYGACPLSRYWDDWVSVQLRELIEDYDPEGIWVDGDGGFCYCERCRERFRSETGCKEQWDDIRQRPDLEPSYIRFYEQVIYEWQSRFRQHVAALKPGCVYITSSTRPWATEYGESPYAWLMIERHLPSRGSIHDLAALTRFYATSELPLELFVCDSTGMHARPMIRCRTKTLDRMLQEVATVAANGAVVGYWTFPSATGALIPTRTKRAAAARHFLEERKDVFRRTRPAASTVILATRTPVKRGRVRAGGMWPNASRCGVVELSVAGAHKAFAAMHHSPVIVRDAGFAEDLAADLVILPEQEALPDETAAALKAYVERGGKLLTTGVSIRNPAVCEMLGIRGVRRAAEEGYVIRRDGEAFGVDEPWDALDGDGTEELYPLYATSEQLHPVQSRLMPRNWRMYGALDEGCPEGLGIAAAVSATVGAGQVVHIPTTLFANYYEFGDPGVPAWLREIADRLVPTPLLRTDAPTCVDITLRKRQNDLLIHLVNQSSGRDLSRPDFADVWVDDVPGLGLINLEIRCEQAPGEPYLAPGNEPVGSSHADGRLRVTVPGMKIHACVVVPGWTDPRLAVFACGDDADSD